MPFIPGKLKPRIKPRLGGRPVGAVESQHSLKNKPEDPSTSVTPTVLVNVEDPAAPSSVAEADSLPSLATQSEDNCSKPAHIQDATTSGTILDDVKKKSHIATSANTVDEYSVSRSSLISDKSSDRKDVEQRSPEFANDECLAKHKEGVGTLIESEDSLVERNNKITDKKSIQSQHDTTTNKSSADDGQPSPDVPSIQEPAKKSHFNTRPNGLKFPKPNLKTLTRPVNVSTSKVEESASGCDATSKALDDPIPPPGEDLVSSQAQQCTRDAFADSSNHGATPSHAAETGSSTMSVISDNPCDKFISEKSSTFPKILKDSAADLVPNSGQMVLDVQQIDSNPNQSQPIDANDQSVLKKNPKILKRSLIQKSEWAKPRADTPKAKVPPSADDNKSTNKFGDAIEPQDKTDVENIAGESIPIIDTTIDRNVISTSPLSDVNDNTKKSSKNVEKMEVSCSDQGPIKTIDAPVAVPLSKSGKPAKGEAEDVKVLYAISAVDYLKRHDHALGDSILRRLIIGDKNMESRSRKSTMCSTCNPQTLKKCLSSLWSFGKVELQAIVKKAAERQKAPSVSYGSLPGKTLFKPSLGRQRAPTLTASTYGKMSFEVKERLAKQYGPNPPQLNKLRMLDLIFYNPSENPMPRPKIKLETKRATESDLHWRNSESQVKDSTTSSDSDSDPDDPVVQRLPEVSTGDNAAREPSVPVPQVRIGDEGQIILAPESLVMKKKQSEVMNAPVVEEFSFSDSNRKKASLDRTSWSFEESIQFYKALHSLGTDFSMMKELFPNRTRANLKSKFKREERRNPALIDKVLVAQGQTLNFIDVEKDLTADKTLRRLAVSVAGTSAQRKVSERKSSVIAGLNYPGSSGKDRLSLGGLAVDIAKKGSRSDGDVQPTSSKSSGEKPTASGENNDDAIFKRPSNVRPPRKRKPVEPIPILPEKRKRVDSTKGLKETKNNDEDGVFKKPRVPKKRKLPQSTSSKKNDSPCLPQHPMPIFDEEEDSDTDDTANLDEPDDECFIFNTDVKGKNYRLSRSVTVKFADPEVPIDENVTIEHDRPATPMSDAMSETDTEPWSDSEAGEEVEVVSIDVSEIASYLEETGAVLIQPLSGDGTENEDSLTDDANTEEPKITNNDDSLPNSNDSVAESPPCTADVEGDLVAETDVEGDSAVESPLGSTDVECNLVA